MKSEVEGEGRRLGLVHAADDHARCLQRKELRVRTYPRGCIGQCGQQQEGD